MALDSDIDISDYMDIIRSFETCAVWSISANTDPWTSRSFLHAIKARVHRCVEALDKATQQHTLVEQLMQRFVDGDIGLILETLPLLDSASEEEAKLYDFARRVSFFRSGVWVATWQLEQWNNKSSVAFETLASTREFLVGNSESLAAVAARCDGDVAEVLSMLLGNCREERSRRRY